jgi:hypothetical protein
MLLRKVNHHSNSCLSAGTLETQQVLERTRQERERRARARAEQQAATTIQVNG